MNDTATYTDRGQLLADQQSPEYGTSPRFRQEVADRLARTHAAGGFSRAQPAGEVTSTVSRVEHGEGKTIHTSTVARENTPNALYSPGHNAMPGANPLYAEAAKVGSGFFDGPEAIARAMAAPHFETDAGYRQAVSDKIGRSQREGFIDAGLNALDPAKRFAR
jgi:hypothetical protein